MQETIETGRWKWWFAAAVVVAFVVAEYGPVFFADRIPFPASFVKVYPPYIDQSPQGPPETVPNVGDIVTEFYPYHALAARVVRQGSLPLWNPNMLSGAPFVGNTQSAIFYPPNVLYYIIGLKRAWAFAVVLERLFAVLFTLLLLRELGSTPTAAVISATLFAFSGFLIAWQGQAMADSAVWLPLICYAVLRLHRNFSRRAIGILALALSMPVLAGHPETAAHLTMTALVLAAVLFWRRSNGESLPNLKFAGGFAVAGLLSIGLASVQMLPSLEWIHNVHRSLNSLWPPLPVSAIFSFVSRDIVRATNSAGIDIPEQAAYLGMVIFLLVPLSALYVPRKRTIFLVAGCVGVFSIIYGIGPLLSLLNRIPYLGLKQSRLLLVLSLGLAVLAGLGVTALEQRSSEKSGIRWKAALLAASGLVFGIAMIYILHLRTHEMVERTRVPRTSMIFLLTSAAVVYGRISGWLSRRQFSVLIVSVLAIDVLSFSDNFLPLVRARDVFPPVELFDRLKQQGGDPFRIASLNAYAPNSELVYDLDSAVGYEIPLERLVKFIDGAGRNDGEGIWLDSAALVKLADRRVDMLNVRYVLVPSSDPMAAVLRGQTDRFRFVFASGRTDVLENLHVLPRAFLVPASGIEVIADEDHQLERIKDPAFNPSHSVILADAAIVPSDASASGGEDRVDWMDRQNNSFELKVRARHSGVLVASQIYYPGWKATVDGAIVPVVPANYALTAIALPPGNHDVRFFYDPASIRIGAIVTALSFMVVAGLFWTSRAYRLREGAESHGRIAQVRKTD